MTVPEPSAGPAEPSAGAAEPSAGAAEPSAGAAEPSAGAAEPSAGPVAPSAGELAAQPLAPASNVKSPVLTSSLQRLFRNASLYGAGTLLVSLIGMVMDPVLSYRLNRADFGVVGLAATVTGMLSALYTFGLDSAAGRSWYDVATDEGARRRSIGTLNTFLLVWLLLLTALQEWLGPGLYGHFLPGIPYATYGRLIALALLFNALSAIPRALWTASEDVRRLVGMRVAASLLGSALLYALLLCTHAGPMAVLIANAVTPVLLLWPFLRFGWGHFGFAWDRPSLRESLAFSLPMVVHMSSHWALNAADRLVLERLMHREAVGLYSAAYNASTAALITINLSINGAYVPQFMRAHGKADQGPFVGRAITAFLGASALATLGFIALAPAVMRLVYSQNFTAAADLLPPLCLGAFAQAFYLIAVNGLFHAKRTRLLPLLTLTAGISNIALCFWWIPRFGLVGAAWATTAAYVILAGLMILACASVTKLPWQIARLTRIGIIFAAGATLAVGLGGRWTPWMDLLIGLAILVAAPMALWATGFFTAEEKQWLLSRVGPWLGRRTQEMP